MRPAAILEDLIYGRSDEERDLKQAKMDQTALWRKTVTTPTDSSLLDLLTPYPALGHMLVAVTLLEDEIARSRQGRAYVNRGEAFKAVCERHKLSSSTLSEVTRGVAWMNFHTYCQIMGPAS